MAVVKPVVVLQLSDDPAALADTVTGIKKPTVWSEVNVY
jgi:hypothetical protein